MNRRDWLASVAAMGAPGAVRTPAAQGPATIEARSVRLNLRHTWTTVMSSSQHRDNVYTTFTSHGVSGHGEGAPIPRYHENAESALKAIGSVRPFLTAADPWHFSKNMAEVFRQVQGEWAAKAAIDIAIMDWAGKMLRVPLYRHFGLDPRDAPVTTFSIGIDTPDIVRRKVKEAEEYPVLKIKVGLASDEAMIEAVRSVTKKPLRVDANEGWTNKEEAVRKINWLEKQGVEFVEQPMPAAMIEEQRWVRQRVHIPIFADEACQRAADIPKLATAFDGVNIKLDKAGGMQEAFRMIQIAKSLGLKTMLGCMISSSVSIAAAAHLSPLVDFADLDGHLLIANDPFSAIEVRKGRIVLSGRPGLGLVPVS